LTAAWTAAWAAAQNGLPGDVAAAGAVAEDAAPQGHLLMANYDQLRYQ
jgi:hypothetical protein